MGFDRNVESSGRNIENPGCCEGVLCATDIGDVSHVVPNIQAYVCLDESYTWHTPEVAEASVSEKGRSFLLKVAKALGMSAMDIYTRQELLKKVQEEFHKTMAQRNSER